VVAVRARPKDQDNWSVIGSEKVLEVTNRMRVTRQTVRLPDDRMVDDYYQIDLPSFASVYAVNEKDEVLLLRQYKHGVGQVCLTLPGGQVEPGEDIEFSARRELLEETGYGGGKWLTGPSLVLHGNQRIARSHIFVACHVIKIGQAKSGDLAAQEHGAGVAQRNDTHCIARRRDQRCRTSAWKVNRQVILFGYSKADFRPSPLRRPRRRRRFRLELPRFLFSGRALTD
jgi:ADP-ribose pyrophosphatase